MLYTKKIGIAPIGWTNDDLPELGGDITFEQCISEMALAGYRGCEIGNKFPKDPKVLAPYLQVRGLEVASAWFSSYLIMNKYEENEQAFIKHRDFLHALGAEVIVVSEQSGSIQGDLNKEIFKNKPIFGGEEWVKLCEGLNRLGEVAKQKEMTLVYHHHMGTGVQTEAEIDYLMMHTNPAYVSLLYDCGHLYFSNDEYIHVLEKHIERIKHVHLKDVRQAVLDKVKSEHMSFLHAVKEGVFTVPGDGVIDFKFIFDLLTNYKYEGWLVVEAEQDPIKANPFVYAKKAREYIRELTSS